MSDNTNCLEHRQCPKCKQTDKFYVTGISTFTVIDDGTDDHGDVEWDETSNAHCSCGWNGKWGETEQLEFMTFCRQDDRRGTMHITSAWALSPEQAAWLGKEECLEDWNDGDADPTDLRYNRENVNCIGVIRCHDCTVVLWDDDGDVVMEPPHPIKKMVPKGSEEVEIPFEKNGEPCVMKGPKNLIEKLVDVIHENQSQTRK